MCCRIDCSIERINDIDTNFISILVYGGNHYSIIDGESIDNLMERICHTLLQIVTLLKKLMMKLIIAVSNY